MTAYDEPGRVFNQKYREWIGHQPTEWLLRCLGAWRRHMQVVDRAKAWEILVKHQNKENAA